jgi:hypothetical protein
VVTFSDSSSVILLSNAVVKNAQENIHMMIFHMFSRSLTHNVQV